MLVILSNQKSPTVAFNGPVAPAVVVTLLTARVFQFLVDPVKVRNFNFTISAEKSYHSWPGIALPGADVLAKFSSNQTKFSLKALPKPAAFLPIRLISSVLSIVPSLTVITWVLK